MNVQKTVYPAKQLSQNQWMKKYKVSSRYETPNTKKMYEEGEYDYEKFIKMIKTNKKKISDPSVFQIVLKVIFEELNKVMKNVFNSINFA
jgi:hypothetical protein